MTSISITIKDSIAAKLERLAEAMDRSRSWIANEAIEQYLSHQDWMDRKTEEAIADIDSGGELVAHEEVVARAEKRAKARRR